MSHLARPATALVSLLLLSTGASAQTEQDAPGSREGFGELPPRERATIWDRLTVFGQGRMRAEGTFDQLNGEDRVRGRMRVRAGASYLITEGLRAEIRLSSLSDFGDPRSPYWDFGDGAAGFDAIDFGVDRFYLSYEANDEVELRFGKFPHIFSAPPIYGEYVWDEDLHPAGLTAVWTIPTNEGGPRFDVRGAAYIAVENGGDSDPHMLGIQGNAWFPIDDTLTVQTAVGYSDWSALGSDGGRLIPSGNTPGNGGFGILEGFLAATWQGGPLGRTEAFVQAVNNVEDETGEDSGFAVEARFGNRQQEGDWNVFAGAFDFDANSIFATVGQDDTPLPGTGIGEGQSGYQLGTEYLWRDNVALRLWLITSDVGADEDPYRVRLDLTFGVR